MLQSILSRIDNIMEAYRSAASKDGQIFRYPRVNNSSNSPGYYYFVAI